ncbi:hypothetical protein [Deinococcus sp. UYEF24]
MKFKVLAVAFFALGLAGAGRLVTTPYLKAQVTAAAKAFTGQYCHEGYVFYAEHIDPDFAKVFISVQLQIPPQLAYKIKREKLAPDGLTYQIYSSVMNDDSYEIRRYEAQNHTILTLTCKVN